MVYTRRMRERERAIAWNSELASSMLEHERASFRFLGLPKDIRLMIYDAVAGDRTLCIWWRELRNIGKLLHINSQIRGEALSHLYTSKVVRSINFVHLKYIPRLPSAMVAYITALTITEYKVKCCGTWPSTFPPTKKIVLKDHMPALQHLGIDLCISFAGFQILRVSVDDHVLGHLIGIHWISAQNGLQNIHINLTLRISAHIEPLEIESYEKLLTTFRGQLNHIGAQITGDGDAKHCTARLLTYEVKGYYAARCCWAFRRR